jgi:hypothetical protein
MIRNEWFNKFDRASAAPGLPRLFAANPQFAIRSPQFPIVLGQTWSNPVKPFSLNLDRPQPTPRARSAMDPFPQSDRARITSGKEAQFEHSQKEGEVRKMGSER